MTDLIPVSDVVNVDVVGVVFGVGGVVDVAAHEVLKSLAILLTLQLWFLFSGMNRSNHCVQAFSKA